MEGWTWIYLLFFLIPLARIIPRIIRRSRSKGENYVVDNRIKNNAGFASDNTNPPQQYGTTAQPKTGQTKPQSKEMMVLGSIHRGAKTFDKIKKMTQIEYNELNTILESLEKKQFMRVEKKGGFFGTKLEIYATDKGFKEYYS